MIQQVNCIILQLGLKKLIKVLDIQPTLSNYTKWGKVLVGGKWKNKFLTFGLNPTKHSQINEYSTLEHLMWDSMVCTGVLPLLCKGLPSRGCVYNRCAVQVRY